MSVSYKPLWNMLENLNISKTDFAKMVNISSATLAKLGKNEPITLSTIDRICNKFCCEISEVVVHVADNTGGSEMISEKIREKITANEQWKPTLIGFENCIGEVEFFKNTNGYFIMRKGAGGSWDDLFTILPAKSIEGLVLFMQGSLAMYNGTIKRKYEEVM